MRFPIKELAFMAAWPLVPVDPALSHSGWVLKVKPNMEVSFMRWLEREGWR